MADQPVTIEKLINVDKDFQTVEDFIKKPKDETVTTRFGDEIMTLKGLEEEVKKSGGYFKRYTSLAAANADLANIPVDAVVKVTSAVDGGDYYKETEEATSLTKSQHDVIAQAKNYTDSSSLERLKVYEREVDLLANAENDLNNQFALAKDTNTLYVNQDYIVEEQAEALAYMSRMSVSLLPAHISYQAINRLVYDLKQAGIWQKLDGLWVGRNSSFNDAKLNWISDSNNLNQLTGETVSPWVTSSSYLRFDGRSYDTGMDLSAANNYSKDDGMLGFLFYKSSSSPSGANHVLSNYNGISGSNVSISEGSNIFDFRINQSELAISTPTLQDAGYHTVVAQRTSNSNVDLYLDKTKIATSTQSSVDIVTNTLKVGLHDGTLSTSAGVHAVFVGASLTDEQLVLLKAAFKRYTDHFAVTSAKIRDYVKVDSHMISSEERLALQQAALIAPLNDYVFNAKDQNTTATIVINGAVDESIVNQEYLGGYIEIQPDSWTGSTNTAVDSTTETWGFPQSLSKSEQARLKKDLFPGDGKGLMYVRFPLGFAYRGYRNIDGISGRSKNMGERYIGQNAALKRLFENIANAGGGLAPEYWCPAPHWVTSGTYWGVNYPTAGGSYPQSTRLSSIVSSDPAQFAAQVDAFTDAIVDDLEYLHQNIAPVRMFGLQNEPALTKFKYGGCSYNNTEYSAILSALVPKIRASSILATWNGDQNEVLIHVASDTPSDPFAVAATFINEHADWIWGYSYHRIHDISGQNGSSTSSTFAADYFKSTNFSTLKGSKDNVFINEFEYFLPEQYSDDFKFANTVLYLINNAVYGGAKVFMPIIHVCKQLGATDRATNTKGYALVQCNLQQQYGVSPADNENNSYNQNYGTFVPVAHNYNAWKVFSDNLPVGAMRVGGETKVSANRVGYVAYKFNGKLIVFAANNQNNAVDLVLTFNSSKSFECKQYSRNELAAALKPKAGSTITLTLPSKCAQVLIEI